MMGSSIIGSEMEQSNDYYVENTVFVAVGKQVEESESVLMWAAEKFAKKKMICILHIHQPAHIVTLYAQGMIYGIGIYSKIGLLWNNVIGLCACALLIALTSMATVYVAGL